MICFLCRQANNPTLALVDTLGGTVPLDFCDACFERWQSQHVSIRRPGMSVTRPDRPATGRTAAPPLSGSARRWTAAAQ